MIKQVIGVFVALVVTGVSFSQQSQLLIKGSGKNLHIEHTVSPKEGIFSIGRMYNVHPKAIASYNKLDMSRGLSVGQLIQIPLTDTNFSQHNNIGRPIYYNVGAKEDLEKVSNVNNKVPVKNLREWNKLTKDEIKGGQKLVVGFLVSGEASTVSTSTVEKKEVVKTDTTAKQPVVKANTSADSSLVKTDKKKEDAKKKENVKKPANAVDSASKQTAAKDKLKNDNSKKLANSVDSTGKQIAARDKLKSNKTSSKDKLKKDEVKKTETSVAKTATDASSNQENAKSDSDRVQPNTGEDKKRDEPRQVESIAVKPKIPVDNGGQGYFKPSFDQQVRSKPPVKTETVTAGIFKMTNGPKEEKYYLLIDGVPSGTIVKIVNPDNNKTVYAKVLGEMSGIRQNQGLNIRISNSAASTLSISDTDKFIVKINY